MSDKDNNIFTELLKRLDDAIKSDSPVTVKEIVTKHYALLPVDRLKTAYAYLKDKGLNYQELKGDLTKLKGSEARLKLKRCCVG